MKISKKLFKLYPIPSAIVTVTYNINSINMKQRDIKWKLSTWKTCVTVQIKED